MPILEKLAVVQLQTTLMGYIFRVTGPENVTHGDRILISRPRLIKAVDQVSCIIRSYLPLIQIIPHTVGQLIIGINRNIVSQSISCLGSKQVVPIRICYVMGAEFGVRAIGPIQG